MKKIDQEDTGKLIINAFLDALSAALCVGLLLISAWEYCNRRWSAAVDAVPAAAVYQMIFRVNGKGFAGAGAPH